jgi:enoyl-CoA hydratase/carnithine racemase
MASGEVRCQLEGAVAHVSLSNPGKFNAMTRAMWRELRALFEDLQRNTALRCIVVRGEGGHFCAGGDISEYPSFRFDEAELRHFHEQEVWGGLHAMLQCDVPVVAHIEGNCMGAGLEIASCCDIRLCADDARFGAPIAKLGFPMAPREAALVMSQVGATLARQILLEAAVFEAAALQACGFLSAVLPIQQLGPDVQRRAQRIASLAPLAARLNKQTFRALNPLLSLGEQGLSASESIANLLSQAYRYAPSAEHREGIHAFLSKRPPVF